MLVLDARLANAAAGLTPSALFRMSNVTITDAATIDLMSTLSAGMPHAAATEDLNSFLKAAKVAGVVITSARSLLIVMATRTALGGTTGSAVLSVMTATTRSVHPLKVYSPEDVQAVAVAVPLYPAAQEAVTSKAPVDRSRFVSVGVP